MKAFNFANSTIKSTEDYQALVGTQKKSTSKVFAPGLHEVTIGEVKVMGDAKDPSWSKISLTLKGPGEKTIRDMVLVPSTDLMFKGDGKPTPVPFKTLKNFVDGLGTELTVENAGGILSTLFSNVNSLVGLNIKVKIGYKGNHISYAGKDAQGQASYNVTLSNGSLLSDASGNTLSFADRNAAEAHLNANGIKYESFPSVLSYSKSETPNSISADASKANW
jgi:hypothetical protein